MKKLLILFSLLTACAVGNAPFSKRMDQRVGEKAAVLDPTRFGDAGEFIRGNFLVAGEGFTHTTKDENGNIIQHWFISEVLPNYYNEDGPFLGLPVGHKEWIGKCKFYYVVDPKTNVIKSWGYDEGGNPESCRDWP